MPRPSLDQARGWLAERGGGKAEELLALMGGAPLLAWDEGERGHGGALLALLDSLAEPGRDPLALAARWESQLQLKGETGLAMETLVGVVQKWLFDLAQRKMALRGRYVDRGAQAATRLATSSSVAGLIRCYNDLLKMRRLASHPLNQRLYLEDLAERYLRALATDRP